MSSVGSIFDAVSFAAAPDNQSFEVRQTASTGRTVTLAVLILLPLLALAAPAASAGFLIVTKGPEALFASDPITFLALALQPILWSLLAVLPARHIVSRLGARRRVSIARGRVLVVEHGMFGVRRWREPLVRYRGVSHVVRSTLNGTHHELVLVHADPSRTLLLETAPQIPQSAIDSHCRALGVREVPAREVVRLGLPRLGWGRLPRAGEAHA